jgi:hypothetical protein
VGDHVARQINPARRGPEIDGGQQIDAHQEHIRLVPFKPNDLGGRRRKINPYQTGSHLLQSASFNSIFYIKHIYSSAWFYGILHG